MNLDFRNKWVLLWLAYIVVAVTILIILQLNGVGS